MHFPLLFLATLATLGYSEPLPATTASLVRSPDTLAPPPSSVGQSQNDKQLALELVGKAITSTNNPLGTWTAEILSRILIDSILDKMAVAVSSTPKHGKALATLYDDLKPLANCEVKNTRRNKTTADPCAGPKSSLAKAFQEEPALCADLDLLSSLTADLVGALLDTVLDLLAMVGELLQLGNLGAAVLSLLEELGLIVEDVLSVVLGVPGQLCELLLGSGS